MILRCPRCASILADIASDTAIIRVSGREYVIEGVIRSVKCDRCQKVITPPDQLPSEVGTIERKPVAGATAGPNT